MAENEKPLHEIVLEILYEKNKEKPLWVTVDEVFWTITIPSVSERQVREVLDWLVHHKKAVKQFGKYQIDKYEFIERSTASAPKRRKSAPKQTPQTDENTGNDAEKVIEKVTEKKAIRPTPTKTVVAEKTKEKPIRKNRVFHWVGIFFFSAFSIFLAVMAYRIYTVPGVELERPEITEVNSGSPPNLYVGGGNVRNDSVLNRRMRNIAHSLNSQKAFNEDLIKQQDSLQKQLLKLENYSRSLEQALAEQHRNNQRYFLMAGVALVLLCMAVIFYRKNG